MSGNGDRVRIWVTKRTKDAIDIISDLTGWKKEKAAEKIVICRSMFEILKIVEDPLDKRMAMFIDGEDFDVREKMALILKHEDISIHEFMREAVMRHVAWYMGTYKSDQNNGGGGP